MPTAAAAAEDVYKTGMHFCANVVCGEAGVAAAALLRAGAVVGGLPGTRAGGRRRKPIAIWPPGRTS